MVLHKGSGRNVSFLFFPFSLSPSFLFCDKAHSPTAWWVFSKSTNGKSLQFENTFLLYQARVVFSAIFNLRVSYCPLNSCLLSLLLSLPSSLLPSPFLLSSSSSLSPFLNAYHWGLGENTDFRSFLCSFTLCFIYLQVHWSVLVSVFHRELSPEPLVFNSLIHLVGAKQTQWKHCMPVALSPLGPCWCLCGIPVLVAEVQFSF